MKIRLDEIPQWLTAAVLVGFLVALAYLLLKLTGERVL